MKRTQNEILQESYKLLQEDRERAKELYDTFFPMIQNTGDYEACGQNLNKCLEIMTKQSTQLLDIAKHMRESSKSGEEIVLTPEETESIYEKLQH